MTQMTRAYIGVGSNLGQRERNINLAIALLEVGAIQVRRVSPLYETDPICRPGETMPRFLNAVFEVETDLEPLILLQTLEGIERELGRKEKGTWAPRTLDLDILFYGEKVVETERLKIPHPQIAERWFVLKPLMDLNPELVHPILKKKVEELCNSLSIPPM